MTTILIFSVFISLGYCILISGYLKGWNLIPSFSKSPPASGIKVSLIVAFRNEEEMLPGLLKALDEQTYPGGLTEIIFADDHSSDRSSALIKEFASANKNIQLLKLGEQDEGKKKALAAAAMMATGELLIFTDADCIPVREWITTIVSAYSKDSPVLIASPVIVIFNNNFFSKFQSLEFMSLIGATAGSFGIDKPVMVNGANLAVKRDCYIESLDFLLDHTLSGDDVFLMLHLKKKYPGRLIFLKSADAVVTTPSKPGISGFINQRMRWASKSKYYRDKEIISSAIIVLLMNLWLFNCFIMAFFDRFYLVLWAGIFIVKCLVDYLFLRKVLRFFRMEDLLRIFILSQFVYFLYIAFTGIAGILLPSAWKGRKIR